MSGATARLLLLAALIFPTLPARAETIRVYAAGAVKSAVARLIPAFEARTGHKIEVAYDTVGALRDRLLKGEKADVAILSIQAVAEVAKGVAPAATWTIGKTGVGMGVPAGAPKPAMATAAEFAAALRAAPSIAYADPARGATAGTHFRAVLVKLGLEQELSAKIKLYQTGVDAIGALARGEAALGSSQATEIVGREGIVFAGFLPEELQLWTVYQGARFGTSEPAKAFLDLLSAAEGKAAFDAIGFIKD